MNLVLDPPCICPDDLPEEAYQPGCPRCEACVERIMAPIREAQARERADLESRGWRFTQEGLATAVYAPPLFLRLPRRHGG